MVNELAVVDPMPALTHQPFPAALLPAALPSAASHNLARMFRDPRVLDASERKSLVADLREAVAIMPHVAEVRVLFGMALSVDLQAQEALDELRRAAAQAPHSFIARLKYGEILMRLRICDKAEVETHQAALLASNPAQCELARRQAATIRTMRREGVERGGPQGLFSRLFRSRTGSTSTQIATVTSGIE